MAKPYIDGPSADVMARTIWGEARGEARLGRIAVGWVIRNRAEIDLGNDGLPDWWGEGIEGVCRRPFQFSCWNKTDPNLPRLLGLTPSSDSAFREILDLAFGVLAGAFEDPTKGSTHYHTVMISPAWARGIQPAAVIGKHAFYNNVR